MADLDFRMTNGCYPRRKFVDVNANAVPGAMCEIETQLPKRSPNQCVKLNSGEPFGHARRHSCNRAFKNEREHLFMRGFRFCVWTAYQKCTRQVGCISAFIKTSSV